MTQMTSNRTVEKETKENERTIDLTVNKYWFRRHMKRLFNFVIILQFVKPSLSKVND